MAPLVLNTRDRQKYDDGILIASSSQPRNNSYNLYDNHPLIWSKMTPSVYRSEEARAQKCFVKGDTYT